MAVWWITEAVDIAVTALLPFVLLPLFGILKADEVAMQYMEQTIFLFLGGFFLAYAMEKWNLHQRIAYRILLITGTSPSSVLAGIMATAFLISMWISNTATTLMLVAAVAAIASHKELFKQEAQQNIQAAFLIGLAYSATIGGMSTIVGTPTNMIFSAYWEKHFSEQQPITFIQWFMFGFPLAVILNVAAFYIIKKMFRVSNVHSDKKYIATQYKSLGKTSREQKIIMIVFFITVLLWFTRSGINFGSIEIAGWDKLFEKNFIKDSTVAVVMALVLFIFPVKKESGFILEWGDVKKLPYRIILLFGGGFALAKGIETSGMGAFLAQQLVFFKDYPLWVLIMVLAVVITLLSEIASNVATITLMLPILASLALAIDVHPLTLMVPATFAASFGFMLVIATAPNTIAYSTGYFTSRQLLKTGLILNVVGIIVLTLAMMLFEF